MNPTLMPYITADLDLQDMNPANLAVQQLGLITPKTSLDMLDRISDEQEGGNVVLGPSCLWQNAAMLWLGSGGVTRQQFEKLYGFNERTFERYRQMDAIHVANSIWLNAGRVNLKPSYLRRVEEELGAMCAEIPFDNAVQMINAYVAHHTNNMIPNVLKLGSITNRDTMALATATSMLEKWLYPFDPDQTYDQTFHTPSGGVDVPMMRRKANYRVAKVNGFEAIEVPLAQNGLRAIIVMGQKAGGQDLAGELEEQASLPQTRTVRSLYSDDQPCGATWSSAIIPTSSALKVNHGQLIQLPGYMEMQKVELVLPKFDISWNADISGHLRDMGLTDAFTRNSDFSGITDANELHMSRVYHSARIKFDEQGVEAAAATVTVMRSKDLDLTPSFIVDRPFKLFICDAHGNVHFAANVNNPLA